MKGLLGALLKRDSAKKSSPPLYTARPQPGGASRASASMSAACWPLAADSRPGGGVLRRLDAEQVPLSAHLRSLEVSAVNGLPYQRDALQHTAAVPVGGSNGEFTVAVGVVDR